MIYSEDYSLAYEMFLAEDEMISSLMEFVPMIRESTGLEIISEGVKDTILKYLTKISEGLTKVWEKFKSIFLSGKDKAYLKLISSKVKTAEGGFTATNFPSYNFDKLDTIKVQQFDYEKMKDVLDNRNEYLKKFYPMINVEEGSSIKESIEKMVITSRQDTHVDSDLIVSMYDFCSTEYDNRVSNIETDLKSVNDSNKNIERLISTVQNVETNTNESALVESYLIIEADTKKEDKKVEIKDDPEKQAKDKADKILKDVVNFTKVSTEICTSKMNIVKDCYNLYMKLLKHAIKADQGNDEEKSDQNEQPAGKIDTQVDL